MKTGNHVPGDSLRVLVATARFLPSTGGTEIHTYETARRLASGGHDMTVLTTREDRSLPTADQQDGISIYRVPSWPAQRDYFFAPAMFKIVQQGSWDLVHCQGIHTLVPPMAMLASAQARIPYVTTFHSGGSSSQLRRKMRHVQFRALRPLLSRAQRLISVSRFEAEYFRSLLGLPSSRFAVIPNGAELPAVSPDTDDTSSGKLIVSLGRLEQYKGHHRVIQALPHVLQKMPDVNLRIAGSGSYEPELRAMADDLGVAGHVEIGGLPAGDRAGMAALLSRASLVTLLSEYESQGIAVTEAIQLKRPVLVASSSALRDFARDGLAREVSLEASPREIATAILGQLEQPLIPPAVTVPSWDDCAARLLDVYRTVLRSQPCVS